MSEQPAPPPADLPAEIVAEGEARRGAIPVAARRAALWLAATVVVLAGLWLLDLLVLRTAVLTPYRGLRPLTPLYAFWLPSARASAVVGFALAAGLVTWLLPRGLDLRLSGRVFGLSLGAAAVILSASLWQLRADRGEPGSNLLIYPGEETLYDAITIERIGPAAFWRRYVESMDRLSLHGRHFPPGLATLQWAVTRVLPGTRGPALLAMLAQLVFCLAVWRGGARLYGEASGRLAAVLCLASPSVLDFSLTSMDTVFAAFGALALCAAAATFSATGPAYGRAALTGIALLGASLLSFSAAPLGLAVVLIAATGAGGARPWKPAARKRHVWRRLVVIGVAYLAAALVLYAATGFSLLACLQGARELAAELMTEVIGAPAAERYLPLALDNGVAFAIGAGPAVVALAALGAWVRVGDGFRLSEAPWRQAAHRLRSTIWIPSTLLVMTFGNLYQMETERIWLFAIPWLALFATADLRPSPGATRLLLGAGFSAAGLMEMLLFTLW